MAIGFNLIPNNLRVPGAYAEISNVKANRGLSGYPTRVLVIGQKLAGAPGQALTPLLITSKDQAAGYFGKGSQLWAMLERFKDANSFVEVHGIALADAGASAAAAGKLSVSGPASAAGTIFLYIGGRLVQIGVASGASASAIASAIVTAITAATELPVSAAVDGTNNYEVNLTAKNAGEAANFIDVRINHHNDQVLPS
ncbi:MAG: phage tail protein, partial [Alphaproteobacteria bacterium]|nr:phage tail protein [Alphaproteobacteria bacterium]